MTKIALMDKTMYQLMAKDCHTYDHSVRVASMAKIIAAGLKLDQRQTFQLVNGCFLHDIGKLRTPIEVLNKPTKLEPHEWDVMKLHPTTGAEMVRDYGQIETEIIDIIEYHHERWDGKGYPRGLKGTEVPVFARICAIIDAFDCMISERPYHAALPVKKAVEQLKHNAGTQFDETYVQLFIQICALE